VLTFVQRVRGVGVFRIGIAAFVEVVRSGTALLSLGKGHRGRRRRRRRSANNKQIIRSFICD